MTSRFLLCLALVAAVLSPFSPHSRGAGEMASGEPAAAGPISEAECAAFGEKVADLVNRGTAAKVVDCFDPYGLVERILQGLELAEPERREFADGFAGGLQESLRREFPKFVEARFLRVQTVDGELRPLVRLVSREGAMNFYGFVVARRAGGGLKWVDAHVYLSGELLSATMRRLVVPVFAERNAGILAHLPRGEGAYLESLARLQEAQMAFRGGAVAEAKRILAGLPPEVRTNKAVLLLRLQVAQQSDEAGCLAVLEEWAQAYPGDPSLDLVSLDVAFLRKDYAGVVRRLESLGRSLGGDPHLTYRKATTLYLAGDVAAARAAAREALAADPALLKAYDVLLQIELDAKNHAATAALLDEIEASCPGADMDAAITADPAYADFRASNAGRAWKAHRAGRGPVKVK